MAKADKVPPKVPEAKLLDYKPKINGHTSFCIVAGCDTRIIRWKNKTGRFSLARSNKFFRFPSNDHKRLLQWMEALQLDSYNPISMKVHRVCTKHFSPDQFVVDQDDPNLKRLVPGAVPLPWRNGRPVTKRALEGANVQIKQEAINHDHEITESNLAQSTTIKTESATVKIEQGLEHDKKHESVSEGANTSNETRADNKIAGSSSDKESLTPSEILKVNFVIEMNGNKEHFRCKKCEALLKTKQFALRHHTFQTHKPRKWAVSMSAAQKGIQLIQVPTFIRNERAEKRLKYETRGRFC